MSETLTHRCANRRPGGEAVTVVKRGRDPWVLDVNGDEYRIRIRFCPFCGVELRRAVDEKPKC